MIGKRYLLQRWEVNKEEEELNKRYKTGTRQEENIELIGNKVHKSRRKENSNLIEYDGQNNHQIIIKCDPRTCRWKNTTKRE